MTTSLFYRRMISAAFVLIATGAGAGAIVRASRAG